MKSKDIIYKATDGLVGSVVDGLLWFLFLYGASFGKSGSYGMHRAFSEADEALASFNYQSFKNALNYLKKHKFIEQKHTYTDIEVRMTSLGKKRITRMLPVYQAERPWDNHLYLVSYDVPETRHELRRVLRQFLKTIGCAPLQESLWMTPYSPRKLLHEFMVAHQIESTILISTLGKDGAIGDEDLPQLLERVYHLRGLNDRYHDIVLQASKKYIHSFQRFVSYQRILADDPQLPFALLPKNWWGEKAREVVMQQRV